MSDKPKARQIKKISRVIRDILLKEWDPLGIDGCGPEDEYDACVWQIYKLMEKGADVAALSQCLYDIEKDLICAAPHRPERIRRAAEKLADLKTP